jgi:hypothetical protein
MLRQLVEDFGEGCRVADIRQIAVYVSIRNVLLLVLLFSKLVANQTNQSAQLLEADANIMHRIIQSRFSFGVR